MELELESEDPHNHNKKVIHFKDPRVLIAGFGEDNKKNVRSSKPKPPPKKRVIAEKWTFSDEHYKIENQRRLLRQLRENGYAPTSCEYEPKIAKLAIQLILSKISSYKQQDLRKKLFDEEKCIHLRHVIDQMDECGLCCYYCKQEMNVLYDISREARQWTVDRINNDLGHNYDNFYLACLECNLRRRRRDDDKFLFTQQLHIVKHPDPNGATGMAVSDCSF